jgi:hypothetical protein
VTDEHREWYFRYLGCRWIANVVDEFSREQVQRNGEGKSFYSTEELANYIQEDYAEELLDILNSYCERKSKGDGES